MIKSMTAFARRQTQGDWGSLVCEMRSINHRFLEISVYLPEPLRSLEMSIREQIREYVKRGKLDCNLRYQLTTDAIASTTVNLTLAREICQASDQVAALLKPSTPPSSMDILRFPGVLETKVTDFTLLQNDISMLIDETLKELISARSREGEELKQFILHRMDLMLHEITKIRQQLPQSLLDQQERISKRFHDAKIELDEPRLEQEMIMFAHKIDIAEEIERAETHIREIRRIIKHGGTIGRRLDFLLQELNREANTLGSKSTDAIITHCAVEMKVLAEQVREQIQNIE